MRAIAGLLLCRLLTVPVPEGDLVGVRGFKGVGEGVFTRASVTGGLDVAHVSAHREKSTLRMVQLISGLCRSSQSVPRMTSCSPMSATKNSAVSLCEDFLSFE